MSYIVEHPAYVAGLTWQHVRITGIALAIAFAIALPAGTVAARHARIGTAITGVAGIFYTIPSLALMILLIGPIGLNAANVVVALVFYNQIILLRNIVAGLRGVEPSVVEAARGMGMSGPQSWWRVELPLAAPMILAGVRLAAVVSIAIATIGAKFAAGGLGTLLFDGVQQGRYEKIVAGSLVVAALALVVNLALLVLERHLVPRRALAEH